MREGGREGWRESEKLSEIEGAGERERALQRGRKAGRDFGFIHLDLKMIHFSHRCDRSRRFGWRDVAAQNFQVGIITSSPPHIFGIFFPIPITRMQKIYKSKQKM